MNLKEKIERARAEAKEIERKRPPEPTQGIYKARLFWSKAQEEPDWKLFAVVDGKQEPLTGGSVSHLQDEVVES